MLGRVMISQGGGVSSRARNSCLSASLSSFRFGEPAAVDFFAQVGQNAVCGLDPEVGLDQQRLQIIPGVAGDFGRAEQVGNTAKGGFTGSA